MSAPAGRRHIFNWRRRFLRMNADRRKALGKGLSALLPQRPPVAPSAEPAADPVPPVAPPPTDDGHPRLVSVDRISPNPLQPRVTFDDRALAELAASIRENGIIQPLIVQPAEDGAYELVAGERRLRAAKLAGLTEVPVVVTEKNADNQLLHALIENIQREDLNPIET